MADLLSPEVFDLLIVASLALGIALAGRRLRQDLRRTAPDDMAQIADTHRQGSIDCHA